MRRNLSVRIGGLLPARCWSPSRSLRRGSAPSTRRCSIRPAATCCPAGEGEITTLDGETLKHRFLMGSDSFGRDIYSRVVYGTQVSLIVGIADRRRWRSRSASSLGLVAGYLRARRRRR